MYFNIFRCFLCPSLDQFFVFFGNTTLVKLCKITKRALKCLSWSFTRLCYSVAASISWQYYRGNTCGALSLTLFKNTLAASTFGGSTLHSLSMTICQRPLGSQHVFGFIACVHVLGKRRWVNHSEAMWHPVASSKFHLQHPAMTIMSRKLVFQATRHCLQDVKRT